MKVRGSYRRLGTALVLAIVAVGSLGSWLAMAQVRQVQQQHAALLMDHNTDAIERAVANEASRYVETLSDVSAAIAAQTTFTRNDFEVTTSRLTRGRLPGASAIGFVVAAEPDETTGVQQYWREHGAGDLRLRTAGGAGQHYYLIFSRALDNVTPDIGRDVSAAEEPAAALRLARARGAVTASHPYVLLEDRNLPAAEQQQAFLLAAPVSRQIDRTGDTEFLGWITLTMRGGDFIEETLLAYAGELVKVTLSAVDGRSVTAVASTTPAGVLLRESGLHRTRTVTVGGERDWRIDVQPTNSLVSDTERRLPEAALGIGLFVTLLAGGLADSRRRALRRVDQATSALRHDIERRKEVEARLRESEDQLRHLALHDSLTTLANRALFDERLANGLRAQQRTGEALAVFFVDLDGFKAVNDGLGHSAGDQLLVEAARRLEVCARSSDIVARLGGDEFAILAEGLTGDGAEEAEVIAGRIVRSLRTPFDIDGQPVTVSCSVGVAIREPGGETYGAEQLVHTADEAMYAAKTSGKNRFVMSRHDGAPAQRA
ncbi:MAG: diguanylate cyclase [Actinomycetota bacterium]|nr:diguanylate cyclase [Actinomycetota bacterium]